MPFDIFSNPELKRNAWIELRPNRIWALLGLMAFAYVFANTAFVNQYNPATEVLMNTSVTIFYFLVGVWATKNAADAVAEEINQKTWDRQRMSGQNPWTLTIGKLFGPTLYQWLGGFVAMTVYFGAALNSDRSATLIIGGLIHIGLGLLTNMLALLLSLLNITGNAQSSFSHSKINTTFFYVVSIVVAAWLFGILMSLGFESGAITWFGIVWNQVTILISLLVFVAWSLIGIHQNLRTELQYRNKAGYWIAFLAFVAIYFFGFMINDGEWNEVLRKNIYHAPNLSTATISYYHLLFIAALFFGITQFLLLVERKAEEEYKSFLSLLRKGQWKRLWIEAPLWFSSGIAFILTVKILLLIHILGIDETPDFTRSLLHVYPRFFNMDATDFTARINVSKLAVVLCFTSTILLLLRDVFFTRYLLYKSKFKNKLLVIALYYVIIYWAIPGLFMVGKEASNVNEIAVFIPYYASAAWTSFIAIGIQAIAAWWWHRQAVLKATE